MSISLDALGSMYATDSTYTDASLKKLEDTLQSDLSKASDEELKNVCKDFESYFTEMVFKEMWKSIPDYEQSSDSASNQMKDYYQEQLISTWSKMSAQGHNGTGLANQMYEQIKRNYHME